MNNSIQQLLTAFYHYIPFVLTIAGIAWLIHLINHVACYKLNHLGIVPRKLKGISGIVLSPLLHADYGHLFSNTFFFIALSLIMCSYGVQYYIICSIAITLLSGVLIWLFARKAVHIGASGLIMGYWGCLLFNAYFQPSLLSFAIAGICLVQFGQLFYSLLPGEKKVSWEGHLFGFVSGIVINMNYDPLYVFVSRIMG